MKLILGSAQFGSKYGVTNQKKPTLYDIKKILNYAAKRKVKIIDTAQAYEKSETILGKYNLNRFDYIAKIKLSNKKDVGSQLQSLTKRSLNKLNTKSIYCLMLHDDADLLKFNYKDLNREITRLKLEKKIKYFGISIYDKKNIIKFIGKLNIDVLECPYNIFDRRIEDKKFIYLLKKNNVKIFVRSIFLQGILLEQNFQNYKFLKKWFKNFEKYNSLLKEKNISNLEACIGFVKSKRFIHSTIIGINDIVQFSEIFEVIKKKMKYNFDEFKINDTKLLNPYNWKKL